MTRRDKIVDAMQGLTLRGFGALDAVDAPSVIASTNGQPAATPTSDPPWVSQDDVSVQCNWPLLGVSFGRMRSTR